MCGEMLMLDRFEYAEGFLALGHLHKVSAFAKRNFDFVSVEVVEGGKAVALQIKDADIANAQGHAF